MPPRTKTNRQSDSAQLTRQWALIRLLSAPGEPLSVKELADQLHTSKLTIARDLATLERHFPLVEHAVGKQKRRYRLAEGAHALTEMRFGVMELLSLYAARTALAPAAGAPFYADLQRLIGKVRGVLGRTHNGVLDAMAGVFMPHTRRHVDYAGHAETIDTLIDAIARRRVCQVHYRAAGKGRAREHLLHPLRMVFHDGALYVFCRWAARGLIGKIAVQRIERLVSLEETFRPPRIDLDKLARRAFGIFEGEREEEVEVLFQKEFAWLAEERVFHPDERKTRLRDGRVRFRLRTAARGEIVAWVLRYGGKAELVRPRAWRVEVAALAEAARGAHR